jgi:tetratricopeptide (TPR) repeat protein
MCDHTPRIRRQSLMLMTTLIRLFLYVVACVLSIDTVCAQSSKVIDWVRNHEFDSLEKHFGTLQIRFEKGELDEFALLDSYKAFYMQQDELSDDLAKWVTERPTSYVAWLASGTYHRKLGEFKRGVETVGRTPRPALSYMDRMFSEASTELNKAIPLAKNPYLAVLNLLNIARYYDDSEASDKYLTEANKLLPGNVLARARYLDHLKPRWGGSYSAMTSFVDRCRTEGLPEKTVQVFSAMIEDDKGLTFEVSGNNAQASASFRNALSIAANADRRLVEIYLSDSLDACKYVLVSGPPCP